MTSDSRRRGNSKKDLQKELAKKLEKNKVKESKSVPTSSKVGSKKNREEDPWAPGSYIAIKALLSARLCSAIWGIITDCDETYNYWEPTHFLLYGKGFQTWEYSPVYALRSYTYLMVHAGPAFIYAQILQSNRMLVFFFIRCMLALMASGCELYFYRGICKAFGANIGRIALGITIFAPGMFISSTAYLPSSFAMYMTFLSFGAWFHNSPHLAIFTTALSTFLGWPFAALIGVPIALDIVFRKKRYFMFLKWCFISSFTILVPMAQIDSNFFGRIVIAPLNLVLYNVFSNNGPDLYGTAPASFYFLNGFLNFNFLFFAALVSLPIYFVSVYVFKTPSNESSPPIWLPLLSLYMWLFVFLVQPHKEERFLYPIYPLICLGAALFIDVIQKIFFGLFIKEKKKHYLHHTNWISMCILVLTSTLSISRIVGQYQGFRAPVDTFLELQRLDQEGILPDYRTINVCFGREWHRFPSSFFLPAINWNVKFVKSEFGGQLPQPFASTANSTLITPPNMNNENKEEKSRYVPLSSCHFLIDVDKETETKYEPRYSLKTQQWKVIHRVPFLDSERSPKLLRAFYIPFLTEKYCKYVDYVILKANKVSKSHPT